MSLNAGELLLVTLESIGNLQRAITTFGFQVVSPSTAGDIADEANAFMDQEGQDAAGTLVRRLADCMVNAGVVDLISFQGIYPTRWARFTKEIAINGARDGLLSAQNVSGVLLRRGNKGRRRDVSMLHVPFISNEDYVDGFLVAGVMGAMDDLGDKLKVDTTIVAGGGVYRPVILSPVKYPGEPAIRITETRVFPTLRTMRSRTIGRGI